jgi:hypothetical protein
MDDFEAEQVVSIDGCCCVCCCCYVVTFVDEELEEEFSPLSAPFCEGSLSTPLRSNLPPFDPPLTHPSDHVIALQSSCLSAFLPLGFRLDDPHRLINPSKKHGP